MTRSDELSPRRLASLIAPQWRFDARAVGDLCLSDVYRLGDDRMIIELAAGPRKRARLEVTKEGRGPARELVAGLALSWLPPGGHEEGDAACRALAGLLKDVLGEEPRRWVTPPHAELLLPDDIAKEARVTAARLGDDPDSALLSVDVVRYRRLFGSTPRAVTVVPEGGVMHGISLHYPPPSNGEVPPSGSLYRVPMRFHRRRFRRYFARLGCTFEDGFMRTVPAPSTFETAVRALSGAPPPLCPRLVAGRRGSTSAGDWVRHVVFESTLPVAVAPRWAVELHRLLRRSERLARIPVDVGMLAHDLSLHAVGLHAVDASTWGVLRQSARARLAGASPSEEAAIAGFFEDTLTRTAWDVWKEVGDPEGFGEAFCAKTDELESTLARA